MQKFIFLLLFVILSASSSLAQNDVPDNFIYDLGDAALEMPSASWNRSLRADTNSAERSEFIYNGDRNDGYLRIRKSALEEGESLSDYARGEADQKLRYMPGYVGGKEEKFAGNLNGIVTAYEYTSAGKAMAGRIYYLRADDKTIYSLHFTGRAEKLLRIRNQTDSIARSFKLKN
jgi:hypothetical protein